MTHRSTGRHRPTGGSLKGVMPRRQLPSVDNVLRESAVAALALRWGPATVKQAVRALQAAARAAEEPPEWAVREGGYAAAADEWLRTHVGEGYQTVFNLTGVLVHSNLGRSLLSPDIAQAALQAATRPVTLEFDLETGQRGDREGIVAHRLRLLTGAEGACVVNNNAAAVLLALNTLALGREVPVSRGELIEIGGSFRLPEVMERAGCRLREVGTTNRTHPSDYQAAIGEDTALLLKAHPSNYRMSGFTRTVSVRELAAIAHEHDLATMVDAGSGALVDLRRFGLPHEATPRELLAAGADLVTFSGDKLLGGAQAGILVGCQALIERINANPMKRALRLDKLALALLDETLKAYENTDTVAEHIPLLRDLALPLAELERRAAVVVDALPAIAGMKVAVTPSQAQIGSGAMPGDALESRAVTLQFANDARLRECAAALRRLRPAVIGRIAGGQLLLDMRGAVPIEELAATLRNLRLGSFTR